MRSLILILLLISCRLNESPVFFGFALEGFPITKQMLEILEKETHIRPEMIVFYLQWETSLDLIPTLNAINSIEARPCLTWEPMHLVDGKEKAVPFQDLLNSRYDDYLSSIAKEVSEWKKPIYIRLMHEMNLARYHWGTEEYGPKSPEIYVKMFRYIVTFFRNQGANNALFVFCPNVDSIPNEPWNQVKSYYPGDAYVDILGMDGYNWDISKAYAKEKNLSWDRPWQSFEELFLPLYKELKKIAPSKPIIVFETATVDRGNQKKSEWKQQALSTARKWGIEGIVWFQANKEEDWRLNQNSPLSH